MSDLLSSLEAINNSADAIKNLYFRPPGIFTNSIITKPPITTLLRDADQYENTLYHIDSLGNPERKDGTRGVVDHLNEELIQLNIQRQKDNELIEQNQINLFKPPVVIIPKESDSNTSENIEENKGVNNLLKKFNEVNQGDYDVDVLCETVRQLLEKYPIDGVNEELQEYIKKWEFLNLEIMKHEEIVERQRHQLQRLNISLNDREIGSNTRQNQQKSKTASELIAAKREEIRNLELQISERTGE